MTPREEHKHADLIRTARFDDLLEAADAYARREPGSDFELEDRAREYAKAYDNERKAREKL